MNEFNIQNLNKNYPEFSLQNLNFSIPMGYVTGFIGKNGAGKTTTIKAITSLINYEGEIFLSKLGENKPLDNQKIGVIVDDSFLLKDWTMDLVNKAMKVGYSCWEEDIFGKKQANIILNI